MDNTNPLRGSLFGGFNKKDVAAYIEEMAKTNAANLEETEALRARCLEMEEQLGRLEAMREERDSARAAGDELTEQLKSLQQSMARLEEENRTLRRELAEAKASSEAYEQAKERLAAMEVDSAKRAGEIEKEARGKADEIEKHSREAVNEVNFSLENIRRETLRMKDRLRSQIIALETSVDDFSTLTRGKQEYLTRLLPAEEEK